MSEGGFGLPLRAVAIPLLKAQTRAGTAILLMNQEIRIIRCQFRRIIADQKNLNLEPEQGIGFHGSQEEYLDNIAIIFGDVHFLLISMSRMWRLFEQIRKDLPDEPEWNTIAKKYRDFFEEIKGFRNHVEHIEGMVRDDASSLGNIRTSVFGFNDRDFYYGPEVESQINTFYEEVKTNHQIIAKRKGLKPFGKIEGKMRI